MQHAALQIMTKIQDDKLIKLGVKSVLDFQDGNCQHLGFGKLISCHFLLA